MALIDELTIEDELLADEATAAKAARETADELLSVPGEIRASLWHNRNFNIFWLGQSMSAIGDAFAVLAMPLLVLEATGSVVQMGLVTGAVGVGEVLAGLISGIVVDRMNRRLLMLTCDFVRMGLYSSIPLCWALAGPQIWLIYVVTVLGGMFGNLAGVAYVTAITNLVRKDEILPAVSRMETTNGLSYLIGPLLAGVVSYNFGGPAAAVGFDALSFAVSAATLLVIRFRATRPQPLAKREGPLRELFAGIRFLLGHPVLRSVTIMLAVLNILTFAGLDLFIYRLKHDMGQDDNAVGIVISIAAIGGIVASILAPWARKRFGFGACYIGGTVIQCVGLAAIGLAPAALIIAPLTAVYFLGERVRGLNSMTLRQQITPDHLLGRATAAFWLLGTAPGPLGAALATAIAGQIGAAAMLVILGGVGILISLAALLTPVNSKRPEELSQSPL